MAGQVALNAADAATVPATVEIDLRFTFDDEFADVIDTAVKKFKETNADIWVWRDDEKEEYRVTNRAIPPGLVLKAHLQVPDPDAAPDPDTMEPFDPFEAWGDTIIVPEAPVIWWDTYRRIRSEQFRRENPNLTPGEITTLTALAWSMEPETHKEVWRTVQATAYAAYRAAHPDTPELLELEEKRRRKWEEWGWLDENGELLPEEQRPPRPLGRSPFGSYGL